MPRGPDDYPEQEHGWASQWWDSPFVEQVDPTNPDQEDGVITFPTAEHYMMYHKALLFSDQPIASQILRATDPKTVKHLGRQVHNFSDETWAEHRFEIVTRANRLKFDQHPDLRTKLLETGDVALVEASPFDRIWGIGKTKQKALESLNNTNEWGSNLLGIILGQVREEIKAQQANNNNDGAAEGSHL